MEEKWLGEWNFMGKKVKVKCRYYQVREQRNGEATDNLYDLRPWLEEMARKTFVEKCKEANGIKGRLEDVACIDGTEIYALNFMRLDEVSTSYKVKIANPAEHIDIDVNADEYIAKNTVCLYDADNGILMIQCNRGSYSEKSIQSYINQFYEMPVCCLLPIFESINFAGECTEYMKLDIRLANFRQFVPTPDSSFERIIDGMNRIEGVNAHIEISLGQNRNARLNSDEVRVAIADLVNNKACVPSAKIKLSDDQVSGVYDLFDNLCNDMIECLVDENGGIPFNRLAHRMNDKYIYEHTRERVVGALEA